MGDQRRFAGTLFYGDGRQSVDPPTGLLERAPEGTRPCSVRRSTGRLIIDSFMAAGSSLHSSGEHTLWVLVHYCEARNIRYTIKREHGLSAVIAKVEGIPA